ncbi:hypothetical protein L7F22_067906 [Adiantum nelumboides]|nr:hypothetical protein [Adiantum nelumboides]
MADTSKFIHGVKEVEPGVRLHYVQVGKGSKILVLLHGFPGTWWQWRTVMPIFANSGYRVIAIDYRGAGNSSKPQSGYDKKTMARDIKTLLVEHLKITNSIYLVGHDIGMKVAFAYAALFPESISKLVLVDAIIPGAKHYHDLLTTGRLANFDLSHFFFHNSKNNMAEALTAGRERIYIQDFFDRHAFNMAAFPPEVIDVYAKAYSAPGGMRAGFELYRAFDQDSKDNASIFANGGRLSVPLSFIVGQESGFLATVAGNIASEIAENSSFATIPDSGHYPAEENPEIFAAEVIKYLQSAV